MVRQMIDVMKLRGSMKTAQCEEVELVLFKEI